MNFNFFASITLSFLVLCSLNSCTAQNKSTSSSKSDLNMLIAQAQRGNGIVVLNNSMTITKEIVVQGNIKIIGKPGVVLTNMVKSKTNAMFHLYGGNHVFENFDVSQHPDGIAFYTEPQTGIVWNNSFDNVNILNGREAYASSRGGIWDEKADTVIAWCGTTWNNSVIRTAAVSISVFSQDGPTKYLHLNHMDIANGKEYGNWKISFRSTENNTTHTLYCHPNVSLSFYDVQLVSGKLALHHYSGGGVPGKCAYVNLNKVIATKNGVEMQTPKTGVITIDSSDIGLYTTLGFKVPLVHATNSNFRNIGNGAMLRGNIYNCTGAIWTSKDGDLNIENSKLGELSFRAGGVAKVKNSSIGYITAGDRDNDFDGQFTNVEITNLNATKALGKFKLDNKTKVKSIKAPAGVVIQ